MADDSAILQGMPVWADVTAADVPAAADFYQHVFGWDYRVAPSELAYYHTALDAGRAAAGIGGLASPDAQPTWTVYFAVADVHQAVARANDLGALIVMEPTEIPQRAMIAAAVAPGGARFGMWQAFHDHGFAARDEHGAFTWCEVSAADVPAAARFYSELFGVESAAAEAGAGRVLRLGGAPFAGVSARAADQATDAWTVYFRVHDADAAVAAVQAGGGEVLFGPVDTPFGRVALFADESRARFAVINR